MTTLREWIVPGLLILLTTACLGIIVFDELTGHPVDGTVQTILSFVVGVLSHQLGTQQGSQQTSAGVKQGQNGAGGG